MYAKRKRVCPGEFSVVGSRESLVSGTQYPLHASLPHSIPDSRFPIPAFLDALARVC
jgi:hypothetical protein